VKINVDDGEKIQISDTRIAEIRVNPLINLLWIVCAINLGGVILAIARRPKQNSI
jgi:hypothetical protein